MISLYVDRLIRVLWAAFGIYWVVAAKLQQHSDSASNVAGVKIKISDAPPVRIIHHAMLALAVVLLFVNQAGVGILGKRFVPRNEWMAVAGLAITIAGLGLAMWARIHLAENWSARVRIRVDQAVEEKGCPEHPCSAEPVSGAEGLACVAPNRFGQLAPFPPT